MARTILRDISIVALLAFAVIFGIYSFSDSLIDNYGLTDNANYSAVYTNMSAEIDNIYSYSTEVGDAVDQDAGVAATVLGITETLFSTVRLVFRSIIPSINNFITSAFLILGINQTYQTVFLAIVLIVVSFTVISVLVRKDS